jgi:hypothetical protein
MYILLSRGFADATTYNTYVEVACVMRNPVISSHFLKEHNFSVHTINREVSSSSSKGILGHLSPLCK